MSEDPDRVLGRFEEAEGRAAETIAAANGEDGGLEERERWREAVADETDDDGDAWWT
jgi:hypothetical protein